MDDSKRQRKSVEERGKTASRRRAVSIGLSSGKLKGKPLEAEPPTGLAKPTVAAARRSAVHAERAVSSRKELPLPTERSVAGDAHQGRSLRLQLRVEGERITVLDAIEVDVPAPVPERVRGTDFLEVRSGDEVLALQRLIDPGIAIGIPDARDKTEFRGHREIELASYELTVRVPLDAVESLESRELQGETEKIGRRRTIPVEIAVYRASETVEIASRQTAIARSARGSRLARVATTGALTLDDIRGAARSTPQAKQNDYKGRGSETE